MKNNLGNEYHQGTKYSRDQRTFGKQVQEPIPETYKSYQDAKVVPLPKPMITGGKPIWDVIRNRRSFRDFKQLEVSAEELSQILWATQGITKHIGRYALRTTPSAGALYPIETYVVVNRVNDIEPGVYHYNVLRCELEQIKAGDFSGELASASLGQDMLRSASFVLIWTAVIGRSKWRYGERAFRYIYMDAGHIGQNAYLSAEALGLGCCTVGAFFDDEVNAIIGVDGYQETTVYLCAMGKK